MDCYIPDSDDELGNVASKSRVLSPRNVGEEHIYSDDENFHSAPCWNDFSIENTDVNKEPETLKKIHLQLGIPKRKAATQSRQPHRRLFTKAVVEKSNQRDTSASFLSQENDKTQPGSNALPSVSQSIAAPSSFGWSRQSSQSSSLRFPGHSAGPVFVGRDRLLISTKPGPSSIDDTPSHGQQPAQASPLLLETSASYDTSKIKAHTVADIRPPASNVAFHRTDDGLNVVYKRQKTHNNEDKDASRQKNATVNGGWGNNFVRIDLKKGKGSTKFKASRHSYRKRRVGGNRRWKVPRLRQGGDGSEFMEGWDNSRGHCFRCGGTGHWAKDCNEQKDAIACSESEGEEEKEQSKKDITTMQAHLPQNNVHTGIDNKFPQQQQQQQQSPPRAVVEHQEIDIESLCNPDALQEMVKDRFGYSNFRGLQLETIQRVLRGEDCLSIMPTGMGKSLCYQLPAMVLPGLTLVVSPLIALMHDQCKNAPPQLNPAVLWSGQTPVAARQVLSDIRSGLIKLLFISPERLSNPHLISALEPRMPLSLVVVDEAHCVAEWGHSFRPSYFRLGEILQRDVTSRSVLALTATATKAAEAAVRSVLRIQPQQVLRDSAIRANLRLTVLKSIGTPGSGAYTASWNHIVGLFKDGGALVNSSSAIVYCAWKNDANSLANAFVAAGIRAKSYHAGRSTDERAQVAAAFSTGRLRVVVATVAFGMGIDVASVDAVVHATMPRSLEEYVQQIGRAGRAGGEATCYAFVSPVDFVSLRSLAYSGIVMRESISVVLNRIFSTEISIDENNGTPEQREERRRFGILPYKKLSPEVDMQQESFEAVLGYLEADAEPYLRVLPPTAVTVKVSFYAVPAQELAQHHPIVRAVLAVCPKHRNGSYSVATTKLAAAAGKPPGAALQDLQILAQEKLVGFEFSSEKGFAYEVLRSPKNLEHLITSIHERLSTTLRSQVHRLDTVYRAFAAAANQNSQQQQESQLRQALESYFSKSEDEETAMLQHGNDMQSLDIDDLPLCTSGGDVMLRKAQAALRRYQEQGGKDLSPLALARILHGTGSAATPRDQWSKRMVQFWSSLRDADFPSVLRVTTLACTNFHAHINS